MNITLFNRKYWIRRFGEQRNVRGYMVADREDFVANIHVHPGSEVIQEVPEGERSIRRLEGHGPEALRASSHNGGTKGDLLYYNGEWYECVSSVSWNHTLLNHYNYSFVVVPKDAAGTTDLEPPDGDPA
jgi:hypothetical protein